MVLTVEIDIFEEQVWLRLNVALGIVADATFEEVGEVISAVSAVDYAGVVDDALDRVVKRLAHVVASGEGSVGLDERCYLIVAVQLIEDANPNRVRAEDLGQVVAACANGLDGEDAAIGAIRETGERKTVIAIVFKRGEHVASIVEEAGVRVSISCCEVGGREVLFEKHGRELQLVREA